MDYGSTCWRNTIYDIVLGCELTPETMTLLKESSLCSFFIFTCYYVFDIHLCVGGCHKIDVAVHKIWFMNARNHWPQSFVN